MDYTPRTFDLPAVTGLSEAQIALHLGLYEGYVKHVNLLTSQMNALAQSSEDFAYTLAELRRRLGFEWNGMRLHELYFEALEGGVHTLHADSALYRALSEQYGSFSAWLDLFTKLSARGPGWALLNYDPSIKRFFHTWVADHEVGQLATLPCLIALDHWEHAYLVDYTPATKGAYVSAYLSALNWTTIAKRFDAVV